MKGFTNQNARTLEEAVGLAQEALQAGQSVSFVGGGTDLLQLMKDRVVNRPGSGQPDVLVNLKTVEGLDQVTSTGQDGVTIGGLTTLGALVEDPVIRDRFTSLAEAAESVATPQIRHAGTLAGNVVQRPWCWYYRNGFPCFKAGGDQCFSITGENQLHATSAVARATSCILRTSRPRSSPSTPPSGSWGPRVSGPCPDRTSSCFRARTPNTRTS